MNRILTAAAVTNPPFSLHYPMSLASSRILVGPYSTPLNNLLRLSIKKTGTRNCICPCIYFLYSLSTSANGTTYSTCNKTDPLFFQFIVKDVLFLVIYRRTAHGKHTRMEIRRRHLVSFNRPSVYPNYICLFIQFSESPKLNKLLLWKSWKLRRNGALVAGQRWWETFVWIIKCSILIRPHWDILVIFGDLLVR